LGKAYTYLRFKFCTAKSSKMLLYLLFAVSAFGQECETRTCLVCKTNSSCDWYGFDCLSKTDSEVTALGLPATATCPICQAGNCTDCQAQSGCSWYSNVVPGVPGKCDLANATSSLYNLVTTCPTCQNYDASGCTGCVAQANASGCGWYVLPGNLAGKCREAPPTFAYTQVNSASCGTGNLCSGVSTCQSCQVVTNSSNASVCSWYTSKSPSVYNSKCDDFTPGVVDSNLYTVVAGTCPLCAGTSCLSCKAEANCKWVAVSAGVGTAFGECLTTATPNPTAKTELTTCPVTCQLYSCNQCNAVANAVCNWFTGSSVIDDSCDLASDAKLQHPSQSVMSTCAQCAASRCYECNNLPGCGWYANEVLGQIVLQGCYATTSFPSGRTLIPNSNSKCKGVPSASSHIVVSVGVLFLLALLA